MPTYQDDLKRMEHLFSSIFATNIPNWRDIQSLLKTFLTVEERRSVTEKSIEEVNQLQCKTLATHGTIASPAVPTVDPGWDVN